MMPAVLGRFVNITLLPYAVVLAFIAVFGGGLAFARFEGVSVFDGVYWANTTINTVGYGDISAQTTGGKVLSMVLQWTGNVILAMLIGGVGRFRPATAPRGGRRGDRAGRWTSSRKTSRRSRRTWRACWRTCGGYRRPTALVLQELCTDQGPPRRDTTARTRGHREGSTMTRQIPEGHRRLPVRPHRDRGRHQRRRHRPRRRHARPEGRCCSTRATSRPARPSGRRA